MKNVREHLVLALKITGSLAIIGVLFYLAVNTKEKQKTFLEMITQPKAWDLLAAGFFIMLTAILITLVRWWCLVRAVGIDFSLRDALRIGFLGYLFNLAPMGIVGGDILKAWMVAKEKPGSRAKSFASVIVDRIVGLYVLFLVAAAGVFFTGLWQNADPKVHGICIAVLVVTAVSTVGITLILIPGFLESRFVRGVTQIPKVGHAISSLLDAIIVYRSKRTVLFWTAVLTVPVHTLLTVSIFLLASGLGFRSVPCRDYFAVFPISSILSTIPLPAGPQETGIVYLYKTAAVAHDVLQKTAQQQGLILALVYRLSTLLISPIGAAYYFLGARGEVSEVMYHHDDDANGASPG